MINQIQFLKKIIKNNKNLKKFNLFLNPLLEKTVRTSRNSKQKESGISNNVGSGNRL